MYATPNDRQRLSQDGRLRGQMAVFANARWTLTAIVLLAVLAGKANAAPEPRIALVIGNANYETNRLKNPRNDAVLIARTLAATGFDVLTVMDGDTAAMREAIADFGSRLQTPGAVALFYYAGHGVQVDTENYLIPLDATIASSDDVVRSAIPLHSIMRTMARSNTRLNIVILDACRDNPFIGNGWTATVTGLASVVAPAGTIVAYSTGPGEIADDGTGDNSPYTAALASEIMTPGASLEEVFRATRRHVLERTVTHQTPWEHSSLVSQFSFIPAAPATASANDRDAQIAEMKAWDAIKDTHNPDIIKAHLEKYPNGLFAELAAVRLAKIEAMRTRTPWSYMMTGGIDPSDRLAAASAVYDKARMIDAENAPATELAIAAMLYAEAAAEGLPSAMYRLGRAYDKGRGVSRDRVVAARWFTAASEAGYAPAMAALGTMHEFGDGAALSLAEALRLYRLAADAGDPDGITSLGYLYSQGKGVAQDLAEARRLYRLAAEKGSARAMYNLALMYVEDGGEVALRNAHALLHSATARGHALAYVELAHLYDRGTGVPRNPERAAAYAIKAAQAATLDGHAIDVTGYHWSFFTRRAIQKELASQGLYSGFTHGIFNKATRKALIAVAGKS